MSRSTAEFAGLGFIAWAGGSVALMVATMLGLTGCGPETDPSIQHEADARAMAIPGDDKDYGNRFACRQDMSDRLDEMLRDPEQAKGVGGTMPVSCHGVPRTEREMMGVEIIRKAIADGYKAELDSTFGHDVNEKSWVW